MLSALSLLSTLPRSSTYGKTIAHGSHEVIKWSPRHIVCLGGGVVTTRGLRTRRNICSAAMVKFLQLDQSVAVWFTVSALRIHPFGREVQSPLTPRSGEVNRGYRVYRDCSDFARCVRALVLLPTTSAVLQSRRHWQRHCRRPSSHWDVGKHHGVLRASKLAAGRGGDVYTEGPPAMSTLLPSSRRSPLDRHPPTLLPRSHRSRVTPAEIRCLR